jgi:hypothetical protein
MSGTSMQARSAGMENIAATLCDGRRSSTYGVAANSHERASIAANPQSGPALLRIPRAGQHCCESPERASIAAIPQSGPVLLRFPRSLLRTVMELFPLTEDPRNPALVTLFSFLDGREARDVQASSRNPRRRGQANLPNKPVSQRGVKTGSRVCGEFRACPKIRYEGAGNRVWRLGRQIRCCSGKAETGVGQTERCPAVGQNGRQIEEGTRGSTQVSRLAASATPTYIVARAENVALDLTQKLVVSAQSSPNFVCRMMLGNNGDGFRKGNVLGRSMTSVYK